MEILKLEPASLSALCHPLADLRHVLVGGQVTNLSALFCEDVYAHVVLKDDAGRILVRNSVWVGRMAPQQVETFQATLTLPESLADWPTRAEVQLEYQLRGKSPWEGVGVLAPPAASRGAEQEG